VGATVGEEMVMVAVALTVVVVGGERSGVMSGGQCLCYQQI
jgi:hypothetical protein